MQRPHKELLLPPSPSLHHPPTPPTQSCSCQFKDGLIQYDRDDDVSVRFGSWRMKKISWREGKKSTFDVRYADSENCISKMKTRVEWRRKAKLACIHRCAAVESHIRNVSICFSRFLYCAGEFLCSARKNKLFFTLIKKNKLIISLFALFTRCLMRQMRMTPQTYARYLSVSLYKHPTRSQCTDRWCRVDA